jgi:hypothetical protein
MATLKNLTINDSGTIKLPVGTTAQRTVAAGTIRFNSTLSLFEGYDGTVWTPLNTFQPGTTTIYTATPPGGVYPVPAGTLTTTQTNQNLTLDPNGTGEVEIFASIMINGNTHIANQGDLRLMESTGNGVNFIAQQAAANMAGNYTITWPAAVSPTSGFFLASDTSGNLTWTSAAGNIPVSDPGSSSVIHYPLFGTNAGSVPTTLNPLARSNLSFVPSTGEMLFPILSGASTASATVTIRGTSNATKAAASVLMPDGVASSSTSTGTLVVTGGVGISGQMTATSIVETSSIAFKENVNPISNGLASVLQMVGVTYDRLDNGEHEAGLIAEEVYKIAPDLVSLKDGKPYGIKYTKLSAYLIEAVKALKNEINQIKGG